MKPRQAASLALPWIGLIACVQLLLWSVGGFVFSILASDSVSGQREIDSAMFDPMTPLALEALPDGVRRAVSQLPDGGRDVGMVGLANRGLGPAWEIRDLRGEMVTRINASTGEAMSDLSRREAERVARRDFLGSPETREVTLFETDPPMEYRDGPLPAFRVEIRHAKGPHLYVDAQNGEITARRNRSWRIFDFFRMLHTMDYSGRDDFNHWLITTFSILAILTSSAGLAIWGGRLLRRFRSRTEPAGEATADTPGADTPPA